MLPHEPRHQAGVVTTHPVLQAECLRIHGAQHRMVAAAPLGDVVKEPRQIGDLGFLQRLHDAAAEREFLVEPRQCKAAQVLHHEQRMGVYRVGVKEVVLHASDNSPERRNVKAQNAVGVHSLESPGDSLRCSEDVEEQAVVAWVLPEFLVDQV